jgi:hypothetical protein
MSAVSVRVTVSGSRTGFAGELFDRDGVAAA